MTDIRDIVRNLRSCSIDDCLNCIKCYMGGDGCVKELMIEAADAIDAFAYERQDERQDERTVMRVLNVEDDPEVAARLNEKVDHPQHYGGSIECIDYIESLGLGKGFCLGSAIKYIHRAGDKPGESEQDDLKKARFYLDRYIGTLKGADE